MVFSVTRFPTSTIHVLTLHKYPGLSRTQDTTHRMRYPASLEATGAKAIKTLSYWCMTESRARWYVLRTQIAIAGTCAVMLQRMISKAMRKKMCALMRMRILALNVGSWRRIVRMRMMMKSFRSMRRVLAKNIIVIVNQLQDSYLELVVLRIL